MAMRKRITGGNLDREVRPVLFEKVAFKLRPE